MTLRQRIRRWIIGEPGKTAQQVAWQQRVEHALHLDSINGAIIFFFLTESFDENSNESSNQRNWLCYTMMMLYYNNDVQSSSVESFKSSISTTS